MPHAPALRAVAVVALTVALAAAFGCAPAQPTGATSVAQPAPPPAAKGRSGSRSKSAAGSAASGGGAASAAARPGVAVGSTSSGGSIVSSGPGPAVVDSGPSADARAVLASIPEPLSPSERVPPPPEGEGGAAATVVGAGSATSATAPAGRAGAAAGASGAAAGANAGATAGANAAAGAAAATAAAHTDSAGSAGADTASAVAASDSLVPVPAPTEPLGERRENFARSLSDTTPAAPPAAAPAQARPDSCWRLQVAAPPSKQEADLRRQAAESVLLVPFVVEHEKQRYKVRNRDCLTRDAADRLRRRAIQSGFSGSFPVVEVKK